MQDYQASYSVIVCMEAIQLTRTVQETVIRVFKQTEQDLAIATVDSRRAVAEPSSVRQS